jgi:hypothetical protein
MAHDHHWIVVTTVASTGEMRMCVECGIEQKRPFATDVWEITKVTVPVSQLLDGIGDEPIEA